MNGHTGKTKNASVELLRFLFTSIIIFFHINLDLWDQKKVIAVVREIPVTFFKHGNIGVEFFFLVTGWLMAKTIYTKYIQPRESGVNTGGAIPVESAEALKPADTGKRPAGKAGRGRLMEETVQFVRHKANAIFPYYLLACALTVVIQFLTERTLSLDYFLLRLPSLFFLQRMGFGKPFIGCTWYLSSMLLALFVVYPLCRRFYHVFTLAAAPLLCAVLLGAIIICTGSLGNIEDWFFITYKTNIRAFAEISLGATAFEISRRMQGHVHSRAGRILLSFIALACLFLSLAYMCSDMPGKYGLAVFYLLFVLVAITFSGEGALCHSGIFDHPVFTYLGKISLPMYVTQTLFRKLIPWYFPRSTQWTQCLLIYFGIFAFSVFLQAVSANLHRHPVLHRRPVLQFRLVRSRSRA